MTFYYENLCHKLIGAFYDLYNELDFGYREKFYEDAAFKKLHEKGIKVERQKSIKLRHKNKYITYRKIDFIIEDKLIIELKVGNRLLKKHFEQAHEYLVALDLRLALLIMFTPHGVLVRRVVNDPNYEYK